MVFVTGGTGLLGTHLLLQLHRQGIAAKAIYRSQIPDVVKDKATWVKGDILDPLSLEEALDGVHEVYHCAGFVSFAPQDKEMLFRINVDGTANVVNACLDAGVKKLVHVSSVSSLGRIRPGEMVNEKMNWTEETSNSEYGKTKYLAELEVWRGMGEGLNAAIVNPSIILGEHGDWSKGSMALFKTIYKGFPWYSIGSTGFVDADDVCRAMIALMQSDISGERFVISGENLLYRDLFFMIADAFGVKRPHRQVSPTMAAIVWRLEKIKSLLFGTRPLITRETARTSLSATRFDNSKFLLAMPSFAYTPMQESVKRICANVERKI
jgi:nucleoside-diphosphate-sugar epimerase